MNRLGSLLIVFALLLTPALTAHAEQPLYGEMDLEFNLGWPGPNPVIPDWVGTVTIDGVQYGMAFFNIGTGKPFVDPFVGKVVFFGEVWVIYEWMSFNFETQELLHGDVLLWGDDQGVTGLANGKYRMNGGVHGAFEHFAELQGRNVHMSGIIEFYPFGAPHFAPGTFRIN